MSDVRLPGFRGEYLWELEIAERQLTALAEAFPEERYSWRPDEKARSVGGVFVHLAAGNFMLLDLLGVAVPADLYPGVAGEGRERFTTLVRANDELDRRVWEKPAVRDLLSRSLSAVRESVIGATDDTFEGPVFFFGEQTTIRRGHLRALAHMHEHMGQLTGYMRMNSLAVPWPDWRPDRR
jgi:hypothetical protein